MKRKTYYKIKNIKNILKIILILVVLFNIFIKSDFYKNNFNPKENSSSSSKIQKIDKKNNYNKKFSEEKKYKVIRVVDGDTIIANINNFKQRIRIIGINTPESHQVNGRVIECFGKEAEKKAKKILNDKKIFIKIDSSQSKYDKHGRLLAHIFYTDKNNNIINFAEKMIKDGFGYEFTYRNPYKYQKEYRNAQKYAKKNNLGLWNKKACQK